MEVVNETKKGAKIVSMAHMIQIEECEKKLFENELSQVSNCLEGVYQELVELDSFIDESLGIVRK